MGWSMVPLEWALRDLLQGRRIIGLLIATFLPLLFLLLVISLEGQVPEEATEDVVAVLLIGFVIPPLVAVLSLIAGGTVLRAPLEDATVIYMLTRPVTRLQIGILRGAGAAVVIALATAVSGFVVALTLGEVRMAFEALPGLLSGGFALGALYGLILSLHRYAIGGVLVHAVLEATLARAPFPKLTQYTISWHAWGGMGSVTDAAMVFDVIPNDGGNPFIPLLIGLVALALTGLLYHKRPFNLGMAEA